ncbi:MAG: hypothetical protein R6W99_00880 [Clostridia bacterium]
MENRTEFDCDTHAYWCGDNEYIDSGRKFGRFSADGRSYIIEDPNTPRPWINYLCNDKIASVVSNLGKGFIWYKSSLLRITKYDHPTDYLPRDFADGRDIFVEDTVSGEKLNLFRDYDSLICEHGLADTQINIDIKGLKFVFRIFVPKEDPCECWVITCTNKREEKAMLRLTMSQKWSVARFGIHTAEGGIPYLSEPGKNQTVSNGRKFIELHTDNPELPVAVHAFFISPEAVSSFFEKDVKIQNDGRKFTFIESGLTAEVVIGKDESSTIHAASGADEEVEIFNILIDKYSGPSEYDSEYTKVDEYKNELADRNTCSLPDGNMEKFLNTWLKHQLFLTFRYVRSGYVGYRDSLQDTWGYQLVEPKLTKQRLLHILSHMKKDGSCPRNFSPFGIEDKHDCRNFMDSATWIGMSLTGYIKETGDAGILNENIRYLDDTSPDTVENHVWKALDLLYEKRGLYGLCLIGEGDWNDGIEGISINGPAVSVWLTIAVFHFQNLMADLYDYLGETLKAELLKERSKILKHNINEHAWDGEWYVYAFSGRGNPIGSHLNDEGKIHLNSNTWAVFTGIAEGERIESVMNSIDEHLETSLGPALLSPPYKNDGEEVGRIARLEPGTFENGSIYKHAVAFKAFADIKYEDYNRAFRTFINVLPTNPLNPDCRRTSEPYCLGNYYCGPSHERFGQNFFSWFTGSPAWLLRVGYDEILGVEADYEGLRINPCVPDDWNEYSVKRTFREVVYDIHFKRTGHKDKGIWIDGQKTDSDIINVKGLKNVKVKVNYT